MRFVPPWAAVLGLVAVVGLAARRPLPPRSTVPSAVAAMESVATATLPGAGIENGNELLNRYRGATSRASVPEGRGRATAVFAGAAQGRPECPHDYTPPVHTLSTSIPASDPITDIPEYHDCQRLLVSDGNGGLRYDSLHAVYAAYGLDSLVFRIGLASADPKLVDTAVSPRARTGVTIVSYGGQYAPLGIHSTFACLLLWVDHGWRARILGVADPGACARDFDPASLPAPRAEEVQLEVRPYGPNGLGADAVPPVARWDWDPVNRQHYIGVRCGSAWCEIGAVGFQSSARYAVPDAETAAAQRVREIKGWYDEQPLAVPAAGSRTPLRLMPDGGLATIWPDPALPGILTLEAYPRGEWKRVATLTTHDFESPAYSAKMLIRNAGANEHVSTLSLCRGTARDCLPWSRWLRPWNGTLRRPAAAGDPWWARFESGGKARYARVIRRPHPGHPIPATVRWRWQPEDETVWVACPEGCCEIIRD